ALLVAKESFIDLNRSPVTAHWREIARSHGFPNAVSEEPRGFHAAFENALNLIGRDTFLAGAHQMNDLQPQMQRQVRRLEEGPHAHGKGLATFFAVVEAATGGFALHFLDALRVTVAAMRTNWAVRPKSGLDKFEGSIFILEAIFGKNRTGHSDISYGCESTPWGMLCQ